MVVIAISTTASIMAVTRHFPGGGILYNSTGELANHSHPGNVSYANLSGTLSAYTWSPNNSGIVSASNLNGEVKTDGHSGYYQYTINASHTHSLTVNSTGGNASHENRMPYTVINRWKRTA